MCLEHRHYCNSRTNIHERQHQGKAQKISTSCVITLPKCRNYEVRTKAAIPRSPRLLQLFFLVSGGRGPGVGWAHGCTRSPNQGSLAAMGWPGLSA